MRVARAALIFATAIVCAAADRIPAELFPPKTRMVLGLSLRQLMDSPLLQAAGGSSAILSSGPFGAINPNDLEEIIIASEGETSDSSSIVVVRGRLRLDPAKAVRHGGVPIFQDRKGAIAVLDDTTAVAGSLADVRAALDRRGGGSPLSGDLATRIGALSGNDFWAVGDIPPGMKPKNPAAKGLDSIERFDFGASLRSGLQLRGSVRLRSDQDAAQLAAMIGMFGAMLKSQPSQPTGAKFDLRADGRTIHVDISIPEAELKKTVASQKGLLAGMLNGGMPAAFGSMTPPTAMSSPAPRSMPPMQATTAASSSSPAPSRVVWSHTPTDPATVVTNERGETVSVTLPGAK
jgi:hypothetical protein